MMDGFENTPFHYACGNKNANIDMVRMLLDTEPKEEILEERNTQNMAKRGALLQKNKENMTHLKMAVKEDASITVLKTLLEAE